MRSLFARQSLSMFIGGVSVTAFLWSCGNNGDGRESAPGVFEPSGQTTGTGGGGGVNVPGPTQGTGGTMLDFSDIPALPTKDAAADDADARPARPKKCDDAGNCACMNIASYGKFGTFGFAQQDNTDTFVNWLKDKSSVPVETIGASTGAQHVPLTRELLANYDVLVIQDLEDTEKGLGPFWDISADEQKALEGWVKDGGGLITLQGYSGNSKEVGPVNKLLEFSGLKYNEDDVFLETDRPTDSYCWGDSVPMSSWVVRDDLPLAKYIERVGAFRGRSVDGADEQKDVFIKTADGKVAGAAKQVGSGRVVVLADEWITYHSQWGGSPDPTRCEVDGGQCFEKCAYQYYQVPQFWYNLIAWVSAAAQCPFVLKEPDVIPIDVK